MFGTEKNNSRDKEDISREFSQEDVPMRTMRDDLDILEGKVFTPEKKQNDSLQINTKNDFQDKKENNTSAEMTGVVSGARNPFIETFPPKFSEQDVNISAKKNENIVIKKDTANVNISGIISKNTFIEFMKSVFSRKVLIIGAVFLTILVFGIAGYYFWTTRSVKNEKNDNASITDQNNNEPVLPIEEPVKIESKEARFSMDKPNYLRMDSGLTIESVQGFFIEKSQEVADEKASVPLEFLVVDENNNPVDLPVFLAMSGINLPKNIINNTDEYAVYFYNDNGNVRMGMGIKVKDNLEISKDIAKEEYGLKLVNNLEPILLTKNYLKKGKIFNEGNYGDLKIRYINLNQENTLSIDYAIVKNRLIIGTSKNTIRAVLDKIFSTTS